MIDTIESIGHVQLHYHTLFVPVDTALNSLLYENYIVGYLPPRDKTTLVLRDERGENRFEPVGKDLSYDFVGHITEGDRAKTVKGVRVGFFGD